MLADVLDAHRMKKARVILECGARLGEGALWDAHGECLWWVDITAGRVHRFDPQSGENRTCEVGQMVGTVVVRKTGGLLVAVEKGIATLDFETGQLDLIARPEADKPTNRFNDGKCDPAGRFWAGTMSKQFEQAAGCLYCFEASGRIRAPVSGVTCSNGIAWSHDNRTMYYIDTPTREVWAYDYDLATGEIAYRRTVVSVPPDLGSPDGMTIDAEGKLWVGHWGGWAVHRWDPETGGKLDSVEVPVECVTSCAFGGADLKTLYITTAGGDKADPKQPGAGNLFVCEPGAAGVKSFRFAG